MPSDARKNRSRPGAPAALGLLLLACGGSGSAPRTAADEDPPNGTVGLPPVQAGSYQLSLSATCEARERTATGLLTLSPVSAAGSGDAETAQGGAPGGEGALLWGQTDLDFGDFASCFGRSLAPSGEPIHPSVLVEVLRWDGARHNQVLLVSTDASRQQGGGVAMWVERVEGGHIGGVWSRWELMGRGEGRWEAELVSSP